VVASSVFRKCQRKKGNEIQPQKSYDSEMFVPILIRHDG